MSRIFNLLLISLISISISTLLKKTRCIQKGGDCDSTAFCCGEMKCKNYRCVLPNEEVADEDWHKNNGTMCNPTHHCKDGFICVSHRCVNKTEFELKAKEDEATTAKMNYINGEEVAAKKEEQEEPLKLKKTDQAKGLIEKLNEFLQAEKKNYKKKETTETEMPTLEQKLR